MTKVSFVKAFWRKMERQNVILSKSSLGLTVILFLNGQGVAKRFFFHGPRSCSIFKKNGKTKWNFVKPVEKRVFFHVPKN